MGAKSAILFLGECKRLYIASHSRFNLPSFSLDRVWKTEASPEQVIDYIQQRECRQLAIIVERSKTVICSGKDSADLDCEDEGGIANILDTIHEDQSRFYRYLTISKGDDRLLVCSTERGLIRPWFDLCREKSLDLRYVDFLDKILFRIFLEEFKINVSAILDFSDLLYFGVFSPSQECQVTRCFFHDKDHELGYDNADQRKILLEDWLNTMGKHGSRDCLVVSDSLCDQQTLRSLSQAWRGSLHGLSQVFRGIHVQDDLRGMLAARINQLPEYELWMNFRPVFFIRAGIALVTLFFLFSLCIPGGGYLAIDNVSKYAEKRFDESESDPKTNATLESIYADLLELQEARRSGFPTVQEGRNLGLVIKTTQK